MKSHFYCRGDGLIIHCTNNHPSSHVENLYKNLVTSIKPRKAESSHEGNLSLHFPQVADCSMPAISSTPALSLSSGLLVRLPSHVLMFNIFLELSLKNWNPLFPFWYQTVLTPHFFQDLICLSWLVCLEGCHPTSQHGIYFRKFPPKVEMYCPRRNFVQTFILRLTDLEFLGQQQRSHWVQAVHSSLNSFGLFFHAHFLLLLYRFFFFT